MLKCNDFQCAEFIVRAYFSAKGYSYMNLTKDERYYEQDVDFIAMKNDEPVKIEVKGSNYSRSFFVETEVFNKHTRTKKDGWFYKC